MGSGGGDVGDGRNRVGAVINTNDGVSCKSDRELERRKRNCKERGTLFMLCTESKKAAGENASFEPIEGF